MSQPEALRLAVLLEYEARQHGKTDYKHYAAEELRRLHAENEALRVNHYRQGCKECAKEQAHMQTHREVQAAINEGTAYIKRLADEHRRKGNQS